MRGPCRAPPSRGTSVLQRKGWPTPGAWLCPPESECVNEIAVKRKMRQRGTQGKGLEPAKYLKFPQWNAGKDDGTLPAAPRRLDRGPQISIVALSECSWMKSRR